MKRPVGVAILAVVNVLEAALLSLLAVVLGVFAVLVHQGAFSELPPDALAGRVPASGADTLKMIFWLGETGGLWILAGLLGVLALAYLVLGVGLWRLRNWGRLGTIILTALRVPLVLVGLLASVLAAEPGSAGLQLLMLAVYVWIIWYLFRPEVKRTFGIG